MRMATETEKAVQPIRRALILAAGRGVRMGPRGTLMPKGFIEVGGRTLIERSLSLLFAAGIAEVTIVTGHLADDYETLAKSYDSRVRCMHNPCFASHGSLESLRIGLGDGQEPVLLLESDLFYEGRALDAVLGSQTQDIILVSGPTGAGDEVYVWTEPSAGRERFLHMSKQCTDLPQRHTGELVGILRLSPQMQHGILRHAAHAHANADYESGLVALSRSVDISCVKIEDLLWGEIDDEAMLERVTKVIWPRLTGG